MYAILLLAMISPSVVSMNENVVEILRDVTRRVHANCVYLLHENESGKWFSDAESRIHEKLCTMSAPISNSCLVFKIYQTKD